MVELLGHLSLSVCLLCCREDPKVRAKARPTSVRPKLKS